MLSVKSVGTLFKAAHDPNRPVGNWSLKDTKIISVIARGAEHRDLQLLYPCRHRHRGQTEEEKRGVKRGLFRKSSKRNGSTQRRHKGEGGAGTLEEGGPIKN